jgi:hypothetical protein
VGEAGAMQTMILQCNAFQGIKTVKVLIFQTGLGVISFLN